MHRAPAAVGFRHSGSDAALESREAIARRANWVRFLAGNRPNLLVIDGACRRTQLMSDGTNFILGQDNSADSSTRLRRISHDDVVATGVVTANIPDSVALYVEFEGDGLLASFCQEI